MSNDNGGRRPLCIGHRGAAHGAPENTIPSFTHALDAGADVNEVDVHCSRDGVVLCIHDATVDRTTNGSGAVAGLGLEDLKALDAGAWMDDRFAGTPVPTLREALDCICPRAVCAVEIKPTGIEADVVRTVQEAGAEDRVLLISFQDGVLKAVHALAPEAPTGLIVGGESETDRRGQALELIRRCRRASANLLSVSFPLVTPELIRECGLRGIALWAWTLNAEPPMRALIRAGVAGITSDRPELLRRVIDEEAAEKESR
ncbi:MAG: glycerophosphodiester phosphodiesterase [Armatimonadota bacterium]